MNELVYRAVDAVENGLLRASPSVLGFSPNSQDNSSTPNAEIPHSPQKHTIASAAKSRRAQADKDREDFARKRTEERDTEDVEGEYTRAKVEIENGVHQLETLLESLVDKNFDKFEIYVLRNVFSVPEGLEKWIVLKHYGVSSCGPWLHTFILLSDK